MHLWRISLEDFARAPRNHDGIFTSGVSTANQITSLGGQNLADRPEFLSDFWSGPILASDDIREHMGEAKNGPDCRLSLSSQDSWILALFSVYKNAKRELGQYPAILTSRFRWSISMESIRNKKQHIFLFVS